MKNGSVYTLFGTIGLLLSLAGISSSAGTEIDCLKCHAKLKAGKVLHAAVEMGCSSCHGGIDASKVPHKRTNKIAKGLNAEQPDLCYGCHDNTAFVKQNVHAAVGMGCTGCHDPHSSKNEKLLRSEPPDLCFTCHDKKAFTGATVHAPVAGGMCLSCHSPHASDSTALLLKKPEEVCLECHAGYDTMVHGIAGFGGKGHPVRSEKEVKVKTKTGHEKKISQIKDPARPGKPFYCAGCHEPHRSAVRNLLRYDAKTGMELCSHCHKM